MKAFLQSMRWQPEPWVFSWDLPRFQAHRGYWVDGAGENTIEAFHRAKLKGYKMFECDVRLSSDKKVVVFHDSDLRRFGSPQVLVSDLTARELFDKTGAPLLEDVLKMQSRPEIINIEIKSENGIEGVLENRVAKLLDTHLGPAMISSFNPYSVWYFSQRHPLIPRALLSTFEDNPANKFYLKHMLLAPFIHVHMLNLDHRYVTRADLLRYQSRGIPVSLWTVNEFDRSQDYLEWGAGSIITDSLLE